MYQEVHQPLEPPEIVLEVEDDEEELLGPEAEVLPLVEPPVEEEREGSISLSRSGSIKKKRGVQKFFEFVRPKKKADIQNVSTEPTRAAGHSNAAFDHGDVGEDGGYRNIPMVDPNMAQFDLAQLNMMKLRNKLYADRYNQGLKVQDFQVTIAVHEARFLVSNITPALCIQVGDVKKYTGEKPQEQCAYLNEYFVFDFTMQPALFMDQLIVLMVYKSKKVLRSNEVLGCLKLDVGTVYAQPDHQFFRKWAPVSSDEQVGVKGHVKCTITVCAKGDTVKAGMKPANEDEENNIEDNLLLPIGMLSIRQQARYVLSVHEAEGVPIGSGYVEVSFAGHMGKTSHQKGKPRLVWNESVVITEMFPPLVRRIKCQVCTTDKLGTTIVATHFLDLGLISDDREDGFLPTFGPSYVNLYGSIVKETSHDKTTALNEGLVEGSAYKGRLLIGLEIEILDESSVVPLGVTVESCEPIDEEKTEEKMDFLIFGCFMDCSMIDKRLLNKRIHLEMSLGHSGHSGLGTAIDESLTGRHGIEYQTFFTHPYKNHSTTSPLEPEAMTKLYCSLPFGDNKPCLFVHCQLPDYRWRLYHANFLEKIADKIETEFNDIRVLMEYNPDDAEEAFKHTLDAFYADCCEYENYVQNLPEIPKLNKLDKEHFRLSEREIDHIVESIKRLKNDDSFNSLTDRLQLAAGMTMRMRELSLCAQDSLPDVFIWLMHEKKRIAYHRVPARDVIFSLMTKERGSQCSKLASFHLRIPGKKSEDEALSRIQGQVTASFWLGLNNERCDLLEGMPKGYEQTNDVVNINEIYSSPPYQLEYVEKYQFELRCHLYQAKCLLPLDESGLSDAFCRIAFNGKVVTSQVISQTLNPTWDETLVLPTVTLYGTADHIQNYPPTVVVEIMDEDVRDEDYMGHVVVNPAVKLVYDSYEKPFFPPQLQWYPVHRGADHGGELLAAFELLQLELGIHHWVLPADVPVLTEEKREGGAMVNPVPEAIRPSFELFRLEVLFWCLRDLQRISLLAVEKPRVDVECGSHVINSDVISHYSKSPKFKNMVKAMDVKLPVNPLYWPAITIRCIDFRSFGRGTLVGSATIRKLDKFLVNPEDLYRDPNTLPLQSDFANSTLGIAGGGVGVQMELSVPIVVHGPVTTGYQEINLSPAPVSPNRSGRSGGAPTIIQSKADRAQKDEEQQDLDWWTKYYASLHAMLEDARKHQMKRLRKKKKKKKKHGKRQKGIEMATKAFEFLKSKTYDKVTGQTHDDIPFIYHAKPEQKVPVTLMKIYPTDLEEVDEFEGFEDWVQTYKLYRGQRTGAVDEQKIAGIFKGYIKICKHPLPEQVQQHGLFTSVPSNEPMKVLVRVYIVKANDLRPTDANRKADPYLYLKLGKTKINDKANYIANQLNPVFAKCFEINTVFPFDSQLYVHVYDKDILNKDDLIGETHVDLENRFYSIHRGTCGIPEKYDIAGYNTWRDSQKPTGILMKLCAENKLNGPNYGPGQVQVGRKIFMPPLDAFSEGPDGKQCNEELALYALRHWEEVPGVGVPLVPEHVEMRSLYHPERPGIVQGKLEMWVDIFTMDSIAKPAVDITAREPNLYELRVTIWNTDDVILEEMNYITGEKMSDIYVKGYVQGPDEDEQSTDIHFRSLTGEGNFNWRFIFPFQYLEAEEKIVVKKKSSVFSLDQEEFKIPPLLDLQVWDADMISKDDFLGKVQLDLTKIPRGAKSAKKCDTDIMDNESDLPTINLFKQRRTRGWWPMLGYDEFGEVFLAGKVEAELHLVTGEEAEKSPVGLGRSEPQPLLLPKRPDTSFTLYMNPLKSVRHFTILYKWKICKVLTIFLVVLFFALFIYSLPGYVVKKLLNA